MKVALNRPLEDTAVPEQPDVADLDHADAVLVEGHAQDGSESGQEDRLGVALDHRQPPGEEHVGLGDVQEPGQERVILAGQARDTAPQRESASRTTRVRHSTDVDAARLGRGW